MVEDWVSVTLESLFENRKERIDFEIKSFGGVLTFVIHGDDQSREFTIKDQETRTIRQEEFEDILNSESIGLEVRATSTSAGSCNVIIDNGIVNFAVIGQSQIWVWNWREEPTFNTWNDENEFT